MTCANTQPNLSHLGVAPSSTCKRFIATVWVHVTMIQGTFASYIVLHTLGKKKSNRSCCQNMLNPLCWSLLTLYSTHHISLLHLQSTSIFKVYPFPRSVLRFEIIRRHWAGAQEAPQPSQPILEGRSEEGGGQALVGAGGEHREPLQLLQGLGGWFDGYIILCMDTYHNLDT